jgi:hypothetical protein
MCEVMGEDMPLAGTGEFIIRFMLAREVVSSYERLVGQAGTANEIATAAVEDG